MHGCVYVLLAQQLMDLGRGPEALPLLPAASFRGIAEHIYREETVLMLDLANCLRPAIL